MVATSDLMTPLGASRCTATASTTALASQNTMTSITATLDPTIMTTAQISLVPTSHAETSIITPTPELAESGSDKGLKIGLGVGISLGVITVILALLLLVVWRRGKREPALINVRTYPVHPIFSFFQANIYRHYILPNFSFRSRNSPSLSANWILNHMDDIHKKQISLRCRP